MYDPDPFAAKLAVEERQNKAAAKRDKPEADDESDMRVFDQGAEVRMAASLRDQVEAAIKKVRSQPSLQLSILKTYSPQVSAEHPGSNDGDFAPSLVDDAALLNNLTHLGFKASHIRSALEALSASSSLANALLSNLPPLEAAIEYLLLHTPEGDLPARFLPSNNTSNAFVSSAHAGGENLQQRWAEDRAVKEAGYPRLAVQEQMGLVQSDFNLVLELLVSKALGHDPPQLALQHIDVDSREAAWIAEREAVEAVYPDSSFDEKTGILSIQTPVAPLVFHLIYSSDHPYPESSRVPPFYITSTSVAPYVRLYLAMQLVKDIAPNGQREPGEGIAFTAVDILEQVWQQMEETGLPDLAEVMKNLIPAPKPKVAGPPVNDDFAPRNSARSNRRHATDCRSDQEVLADFRTVQESKAYREMLRQRQKLPAWDSRDEVIKKVGSNRVLVVVGETGSRSSRIVVPSTYPFLGDHRLWQDHPR